jgi:hypothetical protein
MRSALERFNKTRPPTKPASAAPPAISGVLARDAAAATARPAAAAFRAATALLTASAERPRFPLRAARLAFRVELRALVEDLRRAVPADLRRLDVVFVWAILDLSFDCS